jgi:Fungal specific transcription factor domain
MVIAMDLYREPLPKADDFSSESETRRRLFWTCYLLDRFGACGSRRPYLIPNYSISPNLLPWSSQAGHRSVEEAISPDSNRDARYSLNSLSRGQAATALLIDITRILSTANRYLAAGGMKGDSHFPWHPLSKFSKLRQELDSWASATRELLVPVATLLKQPGCTTLLLSKLIYHLIHCLIYRPFLPIELAELCGTAQDQLWQIEATHLCFSHSNAIVELVELGKNSPLVEWPAFMSYCVFAAGTVHLHGVHYKSQEGDVFSSSAEFLSKGIKQLHWMQDFWANVQYHRELLETICTCHLELVKLLASNRMQFLPVFHLEDFFDRYTGFAVDASHMRLADVMPDFNER